MEDEITNLFGDSSKIENDTEKEITYQEFLSKINKRALVEHKERMKGIKMGNVKGDKENDDII